MVRIDHRELLTSLHGRGFTLRVENGRLGVQPAARLTDEDREIIRAHKAGLVDHLREVCDEAEIDRLSRADGWKPLHTASSPAYSIVETCRRYGVALRIDSQTGDLVVGKAGAKSDERSQPWPNLICAIQANIDAVALLVETGAFVTTEEET
jgi:hypothetical protein